MASDKLTPFGDPSTIAGQRLQRWLHASDNVNYIESHMTHLIQGLGRLDCNLIDRDEHIAKLVASVTTFTEIVEHETLSYLWVLGAYELIRTLSETTTKQPKLRSRTDANKAQKVRDEFARIRIPLAKLKSHRKHEADSSIPFPAISQSLGVYWTMNAVDTITRRSLSEKLLNVLESWRKPE
jgi:hypothetical protein